MQRSITDRCANGGNLAPGKVGTTVRATIVPRQDRVVVSNRRELEHGRKFDEHLRGPGRPRHAHQFPRLPLVARVEFGQASKVLTHASLAELALKLGDQGRPPEVV